MLATVRSNLMLQLKTKPAAKCLTGSITTAWCVRMTLLSKKMESVRSQSTIVSNKETKDAHNARRTLTSKTANANLLRWADALKWAGRVCARDARIHLRCFQESAGLSNSWERFYWTTIVQSRETERKDCDFQWQAPIARNYVEWEWDL